NVKYSRSHIASILIRDNNVVIAALRGYIKRIGGTDDRIGGIKQLISRIDARGKERVTALGKRWGRRCRIEVYVIAEGDSIAASAIGDDESDIIPARIGVADADRIFL